MQVSGAIPAYHIIVVVVVKILVFGAKIGEGIFGFRPQPNQFFRFRPQRFLPNFVKIG